MRCSGIHCAGCGDHSTGGSGSRGGISAGAVLALILIVVYAVNRHAIDHGADVAINALVIIVITAAGLGAAGLATVAAVAGLRARSRRLAAGPQRAGLAPVRGEVLAEPESHAEPLTGRPVLRALPSPQSRTAARSALRPGESQPARSRPGRTWPNLR
jgi:hypothetical protein